MAETDETKVIFRFWLDGINEAIALFPEHVADDSPYHCQSYQHLGQHGSCCPHSIVEQSRLASEIESQPLYDELTKIGYKLRVMKRLRREYLETRKKWYSENDKARQTEA